MPDQHTQRIGTRLARVIFVAVFASLMAVGGSLASPDVAEAKTSVYQPNPCRGGCG